MGKNFLIWDDPLAEHRGRNRKSRAFYGEPFDEVSPGDIDDLGSRLVFQGAFGNLCCVIENRLLVNGIMISVDYVEGFET